jgi:hypothetical protein
LDNPLDAHLSKKQQRREGIAMPLYGPMFIPSLMVTPSVLLELTKQENGSETRKRVRTIFYIYL